MDNWTLDREKKLCEATQRVWNTYPGRAAARAMNIVQDFPSLDELVIIAKHLVHATEIAGIDNADDRRAVASRIMAPICQDAHEVRNLAEKELVSEWGNTNWRHISSVVYDSSDDTDKGESTQEDIDRWDWLAENASGNILDIGCDTGGVLEYVLARNDDISECVGLDMNILYKPAFQERHPSRAEFFHHNAYDLLPFADDGFETVIMAEIVEHMLPRMIPRVLSEATRVGKTVLLTTPNANGEKAAFGTVCAGEHKQIITMDVLDFYLSPAPLMRDGIHAEWDDCPTYDKEITENPLFWLVKIRRA